MRKPDVFLHANVPSSSIERIFVYPEDLDLLKSASAVLTETKEMLKSLLTSMLFGFIF